jgi:endonuclease IV
MNGISPKVSNATATAGVGSNVAVILLWALNHWITVPPEVAAAVTGLVGIVCTFLGGYLSSHDPYIANLIAQDQQHHTGP